MGLNIDYDAINTLYYNKYGRKSYASTEASDNSIFSNQKASQAVSDKGNECTDGKDDGHIGLFSAVGNLVEGVFKGAVNTVKGAFCDENGFSLARTLTTVGVGAACVACPAIGLGLATVGAVSGGIKVGKSIVKAATAETDAEKKDAFEELGEGGLTLGLSVAGAKASYKAVKTKGIELTKLGEDFDPLASRQNFTKWGKALWKDSKSTTANGFNNMRSGLTEQISTSKQYREYLKDFKSGKTVKDYNIEYDYSQSPLGKFRSLTKKGATNFASNTKSTLAHPIKSVQNVISNLKNSEGNINLQSISSRLSSKGNAILTALQDKNASYNQLISEYGYNNVIEVLNILGVYTNLDYTI